MRSRFVDHLIHQLNGISRLSALENAQETQKMIKCLIDHTRYRFGRENHIVQVSEELNAMGKLMELYKIRYGNQLQLDQQVAASALSCYIPHYTLLVFIEYCLNHAFEQEEGMWRLQLVIEQQHNRLFICIEDNGNGTAIEEELNPDAAYEPPYDSIEAVTLRLMRYYGKAESSLVQICRHPGKGTKVEVTIPDQDGSANEKDRIDI